MFKDKHSTNYIETKANTLPSEGTFLRTFSTNFKLKIKKSIRVWKWSIEFAAEMSFETQLLISNCDFLLQKFTRQNISVSRNLAEWFGEKVKIRVSRRQRENEDNEEESAATNILSASWIMKWTISAHVILDVILDWSRFGLRLPSGDQPYPNLILNLAPPQILILILILLLLNYHVCRPNPG